MFLGRKKSIMDSENRMSDRLCFFAYYARGGEPGPVTFASALIEGKEHPCQECQEGRDRYKKFLESYNQFAYGRAVAVCDRAKISALDDSDDRHWETLDDSGKAAMKEIGEIQYARQEYSKSINASEKAAMEEFEKIEYDCWKDSRERMQTIWLGLIFIATAIAAMCGAIAAFLPHKM